MRIAVIGAGAMGSLATHLLCAGGMEVVLYENRRERRELLNSLGVRLGGALEGGSRPRVLPPGEASAPFDVIILAVKATDSGEALRPLSPFVHRETFYLSLQEGWAAEELADLVGEERAGTAVAWVSAEEAGNGSVRVETFRSLVLGGLGADIDRSGVESLATAMGASCPGRIRVMGDIRPEIWRRLRSAAAVSALCALLGEVPETARSREEVDSLAWEAARECERVASSTGVEIHDAESPWEEAAWHSVRPPMLRDVEAAAATEVAYLSGRVVEQAKGAEVKAPIHGALLSLVREMESGGRAPGGANLRELKRRIAEEQGMALM